MTTKQIEPDVDAWREQERRHRRTSRNRKFGAIAVAAALAIVAGTVILTNRPGGSDIVPIDRPSPPAATETPDRFFLDLRTGVATPLPEGVPDGTFYAPSPDGTMVATNPCCTGSDPVWVSNIDGTEARMLTPDDVDGYGPRWSPDGSMLVYQGRDGATAELGNLFVVDVANGRTKQVTDLKPRSNQLWFLSPSFTADGGSILFQLPRGSDDPARRWDLWVVPVTGGQPTLVRRNATLGSYSPEGDTLAFLEPSEGWTSPTLLLMDADGSAPKVLVQGDEIAFPRWSPSGTSIAYADVDEIFVVDVSSGVSAKVADGGWVEWLDDDTLVISPA